MVIKKLTYTDFNGEEHIDEPFYFNLTKTELSKLNIANSKVYKDSKGEEKVKTLDVIMKDIVEAKDAKAMIETFDKIIIAAQGEKTSTGLFIKNEDVSNRFRFSGAFDALWEALMKEGPEASSKFISGIVPPVPEAKAAIPEKVKNN